MSEERERIMRETLAARATPQAPHTPTPDELAEAERQVRERAARALQQRQEAAQEQTP